MGKLGCVTLPAGGYLYVGSAMGGLEGRVLRHTRACGNGRRHWHIDYVLAKARLESAWLLPSEERLECALAQTLSRYSAVVRSGFGSSDCRCTTHFFRLPNMSFEPDAIQRDADVQRKALEQLMEEATGVRPLYRAVTQPGVLSPA